MGDLQFMFEKFSQNLSRGSRASDVILDMYGGESHPRGKFSPMRVFLPLVFSSCKSVGLMGSIFQESYLAYLFDNLILNECLHLIQQMKLKRTSSPKCASLLDFFSLKTDSVLDFLLMANCHWFSQKKKKKVSFLHQLVCILNHLQHEKSVK